MASGPGDGGPAFLGLTGGLAAGKSEALAALERLGASTLSTDEVVHELLGTAELRALLVERLGEAVAPHGEIDRTSVAEAVFGRPDEREWLEGVLWPRVGRRVAEWRAEVAERRPPPAAAVVEVPLLFEAGMEGFFDATIVIVAGDEVRQRRAGERGHAGLESRSERQLDQAQKAARADHVIENNGDLPDLERRLARVLATIGA